MKLTDSELRAVICFHADMLANETYAAPRQILIEWAERLKQLINALPDEDDPLEFPFNKIDEEKMN